MKLRNTRLKEIMANIYYYLIGNVTLMFSFKHEIYTELSKIFPNIEKSENNLIISDLILKFNGELLSGFSIDRIFRESHYMNIGENCLNFYKFPRFKHETFIVKFEEFL